MIIGTRKNGARGNSLGLGVQAEWNQVLLCYISDTSAQQWQQKVSAVTYPAIQITFSRLAATVSPYPSQDDNEPKLRRHQPDVLVAYCLFYE